MKFKKVIGSALLLGSVLSSAAIANDVRSAQSAVAEGKVAAAHVMKGANGTVAGVFLPDWTNIVIFRGDGGIPLGMTIYDNRGKVIGDSQYHKNGALFAGEPEAVKAWDVGFAAFWEYASRELVKSGASFQWPPGQQKAQGEQPKPGLDCNVCEKAAEFGNQACDRTYGNNPDQATNWTACRVGVNATRQQCLTGCGGGDR